ncbi:MAG: YopX family protein [Streptococcus mitis]|nr:YopX family protein [Streptococcus mitis]
MKLKFRAWLKKEQKMDNDIDHISWLEDELYCIGNGITYMVSAEDLVLMQSTGLKDKNSQEIFEGDILKFNDEWNEYCHEGYVDGSVEGVNYVEVVKGEACFEFGKTRYPESSLFIYMEDEHLSFAELVKDKDFGFEIIGNIYENRELLEEKE